MCPPALGLKRPRAWTAQKPNGQFFYIPVLPGPYVGPEVEGRGWEDAPIEGTAEVGHVIEKSVELLFVVVVHIRRP